VVIEESGEQRAVHFQQWWVQLRAAVPARRFVVAGLDRASAGPGVLEAVRNADVVLLPPSNPVVSIGPILAVNEIRGALGARRVRSVAVSPLVGGRAVSGPLDRMLSRMAGGTAPAHVTDCYLGLIDVLVIDESDSPAEADVELAATRTLMSDRDAARRLAERALEVACG